MLKNHTSINADAARRKWLSANDAVSELAAELFQLGSGYGDPEARMQDEHRLQTSRHEAQRLFQEYHDLSRQETEMKMLELQKSQRQATWASFAVAFAVGTATIVDVVTKLLKI